MDTFNISAVLPNVEMLNADGYYRYIGSLTTPPCTEGIIWSIFRTRINISEWQVFLNGKKNYRAILLLLFSFNWNFSKKDAKLSPKSNQIQWPRRTRPE